MDDAWLEELRREMVWDAMLAGFAKCDSCGTPLTDGEEKLCPRCRRSEERRKKMRERKL